MNRWRTVLGNERGVALVLALMILLTLTGLVLAFLSASAFEPQISRNLSETARARYLAEAGLEVGYNALIATSDANSSWTGLLASATTSSPWVILSTPTTPGPSVALNAVSLPGLDSASGIYTVSVRNDYQASDSAITGVALGTETVTTDANRIVIMRATGTYNNATKTLEVVVKRLALPPTPGAVNIPGTQADTYVNTQQFEIDGRDYGCSSNCSVDASWSVDASNPAKYALSTNTGTQSNVGVTYEARVESAFGTSGSCDANCSTNKKDSVRGKDQTNPTGTTTGLNTIAADSALTPSKMATFLAQLATYPGTQIFQSTKACPMKLNGSGSQPNRPTLVNNNGGTGGASCTMNQTLDLGDRDNPKLVYFRGELDSSSSFTGLQVGTNASDPSIRGAGILVVEDGDFKQMTNFKWDGLVIVTGRYVGAGFMTSSTTTIRGAFLANETMAGEANGYFEFYLNALANKFTVRSSKQNLDMVQQMRGLHSMSSWREI
ncbi:MAG TPA: hypothetical protein DDZ42_20515 [Candidatus Rokubacteria bacterium]|nr:MAG: hypothetical protein A2050_15425 [Candidatus Rokubacteria bacterium GWA2_73_35]HBH04263.1 hypothetical protein [Candidatus Rokubacteria bacterium]